MNIRHILSHVSEYCIIGKSIICNLELFCGYVWSLFVKHISSKTKPSSNGAIHQNVGIQIGGVKWLKEPSTKYFKLESLITDDNHIYGYGTFSMSLRLLLEAVLQMPLSFGFQIMSPRHSDQMSQRLLTANWWRMFHILIAAKPTLPAELKKCNQNYISWPNFA